MGFSTSPGYIQSRTKTSVTEDRNNWTLKFKLLKILGFSTEIYHMFTTVLTATFTNE